MIKIIDRYIKEEDAATYSLAGVPSLIKFAWDMALLLPEQGDEIIADLCSDVRSIVEREAARMAAEAQSAADDKAKSFWLGRLEKAYQRIGALETATALASAITPEGIDPHGYCVYLLWPRKGADKPIYVGRSFNVLSRLGTHMGDREKRYSTQWVSVISCGTEQEMNTTEMRLIAHYKPVLNTLGVGP